MKALVIYDNDGTIYYIGYGDTSEPKGLKYKYVEIPEGKQLMSMDPKTDQPIFVETSSIESLRKDLSDVNMILDDLIVSVLAL